jgi:hypothetical protein
MDGFLLKELTEPSELPLDAFRGMLSSLVTVPPLPLEKKFLLLEFFWIVEECRRKADKTSPLVARIWDPKTQESHCFIHRST